MGNLTRFFDNCKYVYPVMGITLVISFIANIIPLYVGYSYEGCIEQVYVCRGILIIWACYSYSLLRKLLKYGKVLRSRTVFLLLVVISFYVCSFLLWYLEFGYTFLLNKCLIKWWGMMFPAFIVGIYSAINHSKYSVCAFIEIFSPLFLIFALFYDMGAIGVPSTLAYKEPGMKVGLFNYMSISYMLMPFLLAHVVNFTLTSSSGRLVQLFRLVSVIIYSFALVLAATRGTVCCVIIAMLSMLWIVCIKKIHVNKALFITGIVSCILVGAMLTPGTGLNARMSVLEDGILYEGRLITSRTKDVSDEEIERFVAIDIHSNERLEIPLISNRGALYKLAIKEFEKSPLIGMYPGGYWYKYGLYPHNIFLEILCDAGIFSIIFLIPFCIAMKNIFLAAIHDNKKNRNICFIYILFDICMYKRFFV